MGLLEFEMTTASGFRMGFNPDETFDDTSNEINAGGEYLALYAEVCTMVSTRTIRRNLYPAINGSGKGVWGGGDTA